MLSASHRSARQSRLCPQTHFTLKMDTNSAVESSYHFESVSLIIKLLCICGRLWVALSCPSALLAVSGKKLHCAFLYYHVIKFCWKRFIIFMWTLGRMVVRSISVGLIFPKKRNFFILLCEKVLCQQPLMLKFYSISFPATSSNAVVK